jgi:hypothetical protein
LKPRAVAAEFPGLKPRAVDTENLIFLGLKPQAIVPENLRFSLKVRVIIVWFQKLTIIKGQSRPYHKKR